MKKFLGLLMFALALSVTGLASAQDWCSRYGVIDGFEGGATATWVPDTFDAIWHHGWVTVGNDVQRRSGDRDAKLYFDQGDVRDGGIINVSKTFNVATFYNPTLTTRNTDDPACPVPPTVPPAAGVIVKCSVDVWLRATNANPFGEVLLTTPSPGLVSIAHVDFALSAVNSVWTLFKVNTPLGTDCKKLNVQVWLVQPLEPTERPEVAVDDVRVNWYYR